MSKENYLNNYLKGDEDYEQIELTPEQYNELDNRCKELTYENVEIELHTFIMALGYVWNSDNYKWYLAQ